MAELGRGLHPSAQSRVSHSRFPETVSSQTFNISRDGNSLGSLFQCPITVTVKKYFPFFKWNFSYLK